MDERAEQVARQFEEVRARTLALFDLAPEAELRRSPGFGFRPIAWHLAHIGVFESYWLVQKVGGAPAPDERYERIFDPIRTPREESEDLPARVEMETYMRRVREGALRLLERYDFDSPDPLLGGGYVFDLVLEHERQHQETLAYLFQMLDPSKKIRPGGTSAEGAAAGGGGVSAAGAQAAAGRTTKAPVETMKAAGEMVSVPAGEVMLGAAGGGFAYDNERPAHARLVPAFRVARLTVTNAEYERFVAEGGYERREFWGEEGWVARGREGWSCPLYWRRGEGGAWFERRMFDEVPLAPGHPVTGVSWYEAEAYARFAGRRLPTEAEWEKAAAWDEGAGRRRRFAWGDAEPDAARCNADFWRWGTTPAGSLLAGSTPSGCLDMTGNLWEWTSGAFDGYPAFEPFPYPEYSQVWFDGDHRVLKGGSWATSPAVLRNSFRNFFRRHFRIAFAGIRLAQDA
ncbi:MAG TPA: SUMF1/EgtB/PvdO family nonheme iron enzyme [Pyrinomonadaceae bacterium]|nr:SUMF1/EgtB/PvdO family nonheme iron enzyme [Pyrinomonadaceae bacterium]